ncbi:hypothetical protein PV518_37190 [Streptomyces sp. ND04-05B]|nr:hypothetical protein [Streptomyces sp. ND04-05B]MDX3067733.1 hypothetical protein [Streptomyces sp. ND04-05B]
MDGTCWAVADGVANEAAFGRPGEATLVGRPPRSCGPGQLVPVDR